MTTDKATPRPWKWFKDEGNTFLAHSDYVIGDDQILWHGADWPIRKADKEIIVCAVNARDDLVEASRLVLATANLQKVVHEKLLNALVKAEK